VAPLAVIDHGRIVAIGSSAELKQQPARFARGAFLKLTGTSIPMRAHRRGSDAPGISSRSDRRMSVSTSWLRE